MIGIQTFYCCIWHFQNVFRNTEYGTVQKRHILVLGQLFIHTHVVCDRYLYYTDWGKTASVVKTRLDGSSPTVIKTGLNNPNGIAIIGSTIYVTDSNYKTRSPPNTRTAVDGSLFSMTLDGASWTDVLSSATTKLKVNSCRSSFGFHMFVHAFLHFWKNEFILPYACYYRTEVS